MTSLPLSSSDPRVPGHTLSNFLWKLRGAGRGPRKFTELGVLGMRLTPEGCCCHCCSVTSNSLQPHGLQPARFLCPWDSPGKNTGKGFHFLLRDLPDPGMEAVSLMLDGFTTRAIWEAHSIQVAQHIKQNRNNTKENHKPIPML